MSDFYGNDVSVYAGRHVCPDRWQLGNKIRVDETGFATWRIDTFNGGPIASLACEVVVTGRTLQRRMGSYYVRVRITFVGDGEPDTVTSGWMLIRP